MNAARPLAITFARGAVLLGTLAALAVVRTTPGVTLAVIVVAAVAAVYVLETGATSARAWSLYLAFFAAFAYLRRLADETGIGVQLEYAIAGDRLLGMGRVPTVWLQEHLYVPGRVGWLDVATVAVYVSYFVVPHVVAFSLWKSDRVRFARYAFELLGTAYAGLLASALVPTAPPWLAAHDGRLPFVSRVVQDLSNGFDRDVYRDGYELVGLNPVAAMPSLHTAMTVVVALTAMRRGRIAGSIGIAYALAMGFSLVYLGEHYVVDVLAGALLALVVCASSGALLARHRRFADYVSRR